jgi:integrase
VSKKSSAISGDTTGPTTPPHANYFAIGLFAGVRPHEIGGLSPRDISDRYIEITARIAKTQKRRLVSVLPNLREWLRVSEELPKKNKQKRFEQTVKAHDVMWHSYASYHLAFHLLRCGTAIQTLFFGITASWSLEKRRKPFGRLNPTGRWGRKL